MMTDNTMTLLLDQIQASTDGDFLRAIAAHTLQRLMEFEVDSLIGAGRHERSDERTTYRNGHRDRQLETRLGTLDLKIPKLRQGTYFPAFLEPRKTAEKALTAVIQEAWIQGVSTRKVDDLVQALGMTGISKSQVSALCQDIDTRVLSFLELDGEWPYLWLDATYIKVRQNGRIVSIAAIIATGVNQDGRREILGLGQSEAATFWIEFLRALVRRGLKGVKLVISDAHEGLKAAIAQVLLAAVPGAFYEIAIGSCAKKPAECCVGRCSAGLRPARSRDCRTSLAPRCRSAPFALSQGRRSARRG
jgi:putative transposase